MTRLVQVALRALDLPRATNFYEAFLSRTPVAVFDDPGLVFFDLDRTRLLLEVDAPASLIYLHVDDLDEALEVTRRTGGKVLSTPNRIFIHEDGSLGPRGREEWQAFITDSEGNTVGDGRVQVRQIRSSHQLSRFRKVSRQRSHQPINSADYP